MPIPTTVADLSTTASANYPAGSESPNQLDDYHRALASIVRQVSDAKANASHTHVSGDVSGLGTAATLNVGTAANQIVQLNGSAQLPAVDGSLLTGISSLPSQTGNSGKVLITNGTSASWGNATGSTSAQSLVRLNTLNGNGLTNTKIARFTTTVTSQGSDITYADSSNLGASFTVNANGVYAFTFSGGLSSGGYFIGLSLNTSAPTTSITGIPIAEILADAYGPAGAVSTVSWIGYLPSGSVVRAHTDGSILNTTVTFTAARIS